MPSLIQVWSYLLLFILTTKLTSAQPLVNDVSGLFVGTFLKDIDRVSLWNLTPSRTYYNNTMGVSAITPLPLSYPYTWRYPVNQTISSGLSFHSYRMNGGNNYVSYTV